MVKASGGLDFHTSCGTCKGVGDRLRGTLDPHNREDFRLDTAVYSILIKGSRPGLDLQLSHVENSCKEST